MFFSEKDPYLNAVEKKQQFKTTTFLAETFLEFLKWITNIFAPPFIHTNSFFISKPHGIHENMLLAIHKYTLHLEH